MNLRLWVVQEAARTPALWEISERKTMARRNNNNKIRRALLEALEPRTMLSATPALSVTGGFSGIGNTGETFPSTNVAVGPNYVVETADPAFAIFNKSTGAKISQVPLHTLFSGFATGTSDMFNSQVLYDDIAGRFVIATQVEDAVNYKSWVDIAVSNTSDPTQGFTEMHQIEVDQGGLYWSDDGKLGYNADGYVFVGNMAPFTAVGTSHFLVLTINKSSVLDQSNSTFTDYPVNSDVYGVLVPARMHGATPGGPMWFVSTGPGTGNTARVIRMDNELSLTPTFTSFQLPVSLYTPSYNSAQPAGYVGGLPVNDVEASDCRTLDVDWNNNNLVAAFNGAAGANLDAAAQWLQFNTSGATPVVVNQGYVHPANGIGTYYPSIAVDANGDIGFAYQESSATEYISIYVTGRLASDPAGTMQTPIRVAAGSNTISWRQGDYSGISLDPSSPNTFWAANEYGLNFWSTWIAKFQLTPSNTVNQAPTVATAANSSQSPVTGATTNLSVLGADDAGESNLTYTWALLGTPPAPVSFSANGNNAAKNTTATFTKPGTYNFQVTIADSGGLSTTSSVTVTVNQTLTSISISALTTSLNENQTSQFSATAFDQFGIILLTQPSFTWSLVGPGVLSTTGLYTAPSAAGTATVTASSGAVSGSATVAVNNAVPTVAAPAGASPAIVSGTSTALSVLGADDGGEANLAYMWATIGTPPAPVSFSANGSNAAKNTTVTFSQAGVYSFQVTITDSSGLSTTSSVTVTVNQTLTSISLLPGTADLPENSTQQFTASAADQFGKTMVNPPNFTWSLAAGIGSIGNSGVYTAPASTGSATVTASSGGISASASANIVGTGPTIAAAASSSDTPVTGTTTDLSVLGADLVGESSLIYTWSILSKPSGASDALFSDNGTNTAKNTTATFFKAGSYSFQVTVTDPAGLTATSTATVTVDQTLTNIAVSPGSVTVFNGAMQQFSATALDQFGDPLASQPSFSWLVGGIGAVDATGLYTAPLSGSGSATISASIDTAVSSSTGVAIPAAAPAAPASGDASVTVTALPNSINLTATVVSSTKVTLSWTSTASESGYYVLRSTNGGSTWSKLATLSATSTSYADTHVSAGYTYSYKVQGYNSVGSTFSNQAGVTMAPKAPGSLAVKQTTSNSIKIAWADVTGESGFIIERSRDGTNWSQVSTVGAKVLYYVDSGLNPSTLYYYRVRAFNAGGTSSASSAVKSTTASAPPVAPSGLIAVAISSAQVNLSWADNSTNESGFRIFRSTDGGQTWTQVVQLGSNVTAYADTSVTSGVSYAYRVVAYSSIGVSADSNWVQVGT